MPGPAVVLWGDDTAGSVAPTIVGMTRSGVVVAFAAVMLMSACGDATEEADVQATSAPDATATTPSITTPTATTPFVTSPLTVVADTEEVTVPSSPDIDPALQGLVDQATADLATRLSVDASTISTVSAKSVACSPRRVLACVR